MNYEEIIVAFDDCVDLNIPDLTVIDWRSIDYLGWIHPTGHEGYVVLQSPNTGMIRGIRMNRSQRKTRRRRMEMCSWCHHVHKTNGTAMFTVSVKGSDGRHILGNVICRNLDCSLRVRNLIEPESFMSESLYELARIWRMQQHMHKWLGRANQI